VRDGFKFRSDRLALDLPATLAGRLRAEPRELLATPHDLGRWLAAAGLGGAVAPGPGDLRAARELREALYRLGVAAAGGRRSAAADRALVNRWAVRAPAPQLREEGWAWSRNDVPSLLGAVARDGVELFGGPLAERVRQCEGEGCSLLFVDTSHAGARRWCSMAGCGNRAKVAEFRQRRRDGSD
jgi:predicted RNA-binding Zn ribbon-like protein